MSYRLTATSFGLVFIFIAAGCGGTADGVTEPSTATDDAGVSAESDALEGDDDALGSQADSSSEADASGPESPCWSGLQLCEGDGVITCVDGAWSEIVPCNSGSCEDGVCVDCSPQCEGKVCGPDGCGDSCGECPEGVACDAGLCGECTPQCEGLECGDDGCGGSCGVCEGGQGCSEGLCACVPECAGKECGGDGCGGACGICLGDFSCNELGECVPEAYRAILIQGHWTGGVGCSQYNSTGADINAVELRGADGELVSYFIEVIEEVGVDQCQNDYTNTESAIGPPDDDYMALQGGWIMGRFADYVPVDSGMSLIVHESYSAEPYSIYLVTGFDCAESDDPGACSVLLTDEGNGSVEVEIP